MKSRVGGGGGGGLQWCKVSLCLGACGWFNIVSDAGVWGSVGFHAVVGMSTCPKATVLIPSNI